MYNTVIVKVKKVAKAVVNVKKVAKAVVKVKKVDKAEKIPDPDENTSAIALLTEFNNLTWAHQLKIAPEPLDACIRQYEDYDYLFLFQRKVPYSWQDWYEENTEGKTLEEINTVMKSFFANLRKVVDTFVKEKNLYHGDLLFKNIRFNDKKKVDTMQIIDWEHLGEAKKKELKEHAEKLAQEEAAEDLVAEQEKSKELAEDDWSFDPYFLPKAKPEPTAEQKTAKAPAQDPAILSPDHAIINRQETKWEKILQIQRNADASQKSRLTPKQVSDLFSTTGYDAWLLKDELAEVYRSINNTKD